MRLFIAIDVPDEVKDEINRVQNELLDENVICSRTKSFHLTLKFLGEVSDPQKIIKAMEKVSFDPFTLKLTDLGVFPNDKYVRVLWIGIENSKRLVTLHKDIQDALGEYNFKDDFNYVPHLTLARVKHIKDKEAFRKKLKETEINKMEFDVNSFTLYKSELTPDGPFYEKIAEFK